MGARAFAISFLLLVAFGVWFQQAYMAVYSAEFDAQRMGAGFTSELLTVKPFRAVQYRGEALASRVAADEARYFTNGRVVLAGKVRYEDFDEQGAPRLALDAKRALGQLQVSGSGAGFFDSERKLEHVEIPGDVRITLAGTDVVGTKKIRVDFIKGLLETTEPVTLAGPGRTMRGTGLTYNMDSQEFRLGGRVSGELVPPPRESSSGRRQGRRE
jgi:hypothetical protein